MFQRILITGAGGFIGSHICQYFGSRGHSIAAVGRFSVTPASSNLYPNLWKMGGMTLPDGAFHNMVAAFKPTLLIHCAGTASVADSVQHPYTDFQKTVEVCAFTLEAIRTLAPACRFVLLSSASVYGNPESLPVSENAPRKPISPYGYHKILSETLAEEYASLYGLKVSILRVFSAYGERLQRQVVHDICRKFSDSAVSNMELFGSGNESRDFIHALDIARAIGCIHEADANGIFNLASGLQTTIAELVEIIGELFCREKQITFNGETRHGDPLYWQADIGKITTLGFHQEISLREGLARYVAWFRSLHENGDLIRL